MKNKWFADILLLWTMFLSMWGILSLLGKYIWVSVFLCSLVVLWGIRKRSKWHENIDRERLLELMLSMSYKTSRQVEFDIKRGKRIYFEIWSGKGVSKGIAWINDKNILEIKFKGSVTINSVESSSIDEAVHALAMSFSEVKAIVVKEEFLEYITENNIVI